MSLIPITRSGPFLFETVISPTLKSAKYARRNADENKQYSYLFVHIVCKTLTITLKEWIGYWATHIFTWFAAS